jgi:hypothetical protein
MEYSSVIFDDFVIEDEANWSQICDKCFTKRFINHHVSIIPIANLICGVEGCQNEADYYLDFICETIGAEKT